MPPTEGSNPLFTIVLRPTFDVEAIRRTVAGAESQDVREVEFICLGSDSDDDRLRHLTMLADADPRVRLLATSAACEPAQQFLLALRQCRGTYIAIAPAQGTFSEGVFKRAIREFDAEPEAGGVCFADFLIDAGGGVAPHVDIVSLLLSPHRPHLPSGFFRRRALVDCGLEDAAWSHGAIELDIWSRIATSFGIRSSPHTAVSDANPMAEFSLPSTGIEQVVDERLAIVARVFSDEGFFTGSGPALALESQVNQLSLLRDQLRSAGLSEGVRLAEHRLRHCVDSLRTLLMSDHRALKSLDRLTRPRLQALGVFATPVLALLNLLQRTPGRLGIHAAYTWWNFWLLQPWLTRRILVHGHPSSAGDEKRPCFDTFTDLYRQAAEIYDSRGKIGQALKMWGCAGTAPDVVVAGLACQALLKLPNVSDTNLSEHQRQWIAPHVRGTPIVEGHRSRNTAAGKIRIGYHCSFMNGDTIRSIMKNVIAAHDRDQFEIYGYSPHRFVEGQTPKFDVFRYVPSTNELVGDRPTSSVGVNDRAFANIVRSDGIDIFVEMSGFTPGHRLLAMSQRIAPVQISYLNHLGSTQIPNIDYVLGDDIATPIGAADRPFYSEKIYRLRGCFLSYDYRLADEPPVAPVPSLRNSFVTFGYFGSGSKLNTGVVETWADLLRRVPDSKLQIRNLQLSNAGNRRFLKEQFNRFGIPSDRLLVEGGVPRPRLMELYSQIDISLDTWPYCGGNTIAESLWQGVPVITYCGKRFINSYGASLLTASGCGDLVAHSLDEYVEVAVGLARDEDKRRVLREKLRDMCVQFGLADSQGLARRLEEAYVDMLSARQP